MHCAFGAPSLRSGRGPPWTCVHSGSLRPRGAARAAPTRKGLERSGCKLIGVLAALLAGCYVPVKKVTLRIELPPELAGQAKDLKVLPAIAELRRQSAGGVVALELKQEAAHVRLLLPGACSRRVDLAALAVDKPTGLVLQPLFDVGPPERVVGLGNAFELHAQPNCVEAERARASFSVVAGAPLDDVAVAQNGRRFRAATRPTPPSTNTLLGIVPVSARAQRELRSEITFRAQLPDGQHFELKLGVSAVARSSGLSDVALSHPLLLAGDGWTLLDKPPASRASLRSVGKLFELRPDETGRYRLSDASGRTLSVHSGRYDQMPLDCGRAGCHAEIAESTRQSPMTQVLASDLGGCHALSDPTCASACHATGEPGTEDGGFTHVASELGLPALPTEYDDLPRALRRLGGVGCMACHGPTKIPEPSERFALMKNDVCAVCHDAAPRYGHVQALASSRMGHADSSPAARNNPACARCHTAWGAVGRPAPPQAAAGFGITCATCHDVHPHGALGAQTAAAAADVPSHGGLLRDFALPATLPNPPASFQGVSRVCIACHAPSSNTLRPEASAAALVAGQGGLEPATGGPLALAAPHAAAAKGCLSCHDSGPESLILGTNHGFRATEQSCARCHDTPKPRDPSIAQRAQQLLARLDPRHSAGDVGKPWHASYQRLLPTPQQTRALRDVLLVLEDPAADVHHPSYARALLDAAERLAPGAKP
jgi:hypothetical protein